MVNYLFVALWIPIPRKLKNRTIAVARVLPYGIWKTTRTSLELLMAQPPLLDIREEGHSW